MDHLIDVGPYDHPPTPNAEDEAPPPPIGEDTKEEDSVGGNELVDGEEEL